MAEMYCANFLYNGTESSTYNLVFANIDTSRFTQLYGSFSSNFVFNRKTRSKYISNDVYTDSPVSLDIDIVTEDGSPIAASQLRTIENWLFIQRDYKQLYIHDPSMEETVDGVVKKLYLRCRFLNPEKQEYNGGIVGFKCTMECDSNVFWQDAIGQTFQGGSGTHTYTINVDSDIDGYIYPYVEIRMSSSGGGSGWQGIIDIKNTTDDVGRVSRFENVPAGDTVKMYNDINYTTHYSYFVKKNFIRLLNGTNTIVVTGGIDIDSIKFSYQNRRLF